MEAMLSRCRDPSALVIPCSSLLLDRSALVGREIPRDDEMCAGEGGRVIDACGPLQFSKIIIR